MVSRIKDFPRTITDLIIFLPMQLRLGSSADTREIGDLVLNRLCPALNQVVGNGLKPFLNGFQMFGRVNVTVWKVAEISAEQGNVLIIRFKVTNNCLTLNILTRL